MYSYMSDLQNAWPLGTIVAEERVSHRFYCADDVTLEKIKMYYGEDNVERVSPHHVVAYNTNIKAIDGYMTDGTYWYPLTRFGDKWEVYNSREF